MELLPKHCKSVSKFIFSWSRPKDLGLQTLLKQNSVHFPLLPSLQVPCSSSFLEIQGQPLGCVRGGVRQAGWHPCPDGDERRHLFGALRAQPSADQDVGHGWWQNQAHCRRSQHAGHIIVPRGEDNPGGRFCQLWQPGGHVRQLHSRHLPHSWCKAGRWEGTHFLVLMHVYGHVWMV